MALSSQNGSGRADGNHHLPGLNGSVFLFLFVPLLFTRMFHGIFGLKIIHQRKGGLGIGFIGPRRHIGIVVHRVGDLH